MNVDTIEPANMAQPDESLIRECIEGSEDAWSELIKRYRRLIFSIPIRYGLSREDAGEIFQEVCLTLVAELPRLRDARSLPAWLIRVAVSKALHWRKVHNRLLETQLDAEQNQGGAVCDPGPELLQELLREQALRDAIAALEPRCAALVEMLFFANPPCPYEDVAKRLALAKGSIGFIRMRCLERLRRTLQEKGFR